MQLKKHLFLFSLLIVLLAACSPKEERHPHLVIQTEAGNIEVELYTDQAPVTAAAFLSHVKAGYYRNSSFYRLLSDDNQPSNAFKANLIQGGIWKTNHKIAVSLPGILHEPTNKTHLRHKNGTLSMARQEPGTATTEFFICMGDQPGFDFGGENNPDRQGYAAFGQVVKGMDVVDHIYNRSAYEQSFDPPVAILDIRVR